MDDETISCAPPDVLAVPEPNRGGRRPLSDTLRLRPRSLRMTDDDWDLLLRLGGATWMRDALARERRRRLRKPRATASGAP